MTTRMRAADRREQLLDAAEDVFAKNGFDSTRMEDIAERAGVAKSLLFKYWPSKESLFLELRGRLLADQLTVMRGTIYQNDRLADRTAAIIDALVDWHVRNPKALPILAPVPSLLETIDETDTAYQLASEVNEDVHPAFAPLLPLTTALQSGAVLAGIRAMHDYRLDPALVKRVLRAYVLGMLERLARMLGGTLPGVEDHLPFFSSESCEPSIPAWSRLFAASLLDSGLTEGDRTVAPWETPHNG